MKYLTIILCSSFIIAPALAFRGGGGGGFRGGNVSVGVGVSSGGMGPRGNVNVGVGVSGSRGSVYAHRSAAMSAHYHAYAPTYWGWYGYAPFHYYYPTTHVTTYTEVNVKQPEPTEIGDVAYELPVDCKSETINEITYKHCGKNWYEPQFSGTEIEYVKVESPALK